MKSTVYRRSSSWLCFDQWDLYCSLASLFSFSCSFYFKINLKIQLQYADARTLFHKEIHWNCFKPTEQCEKINIQDFN